MQGWDCLAGIEQAGRIEGALDGEERVAFGGRELHAHRADLLHADAVLAGDRAAERDAEFENVGAERVGAFPFARLVRVEQDQRMQIAVAGVEHVHAAQRVFLFHLFDRAQHAAEMLARNRAVHAVVVGRDAAGGRKRVFASRPEAQALGFRLRDDALRRTGGLEHALDLGDLLGDFLGRAVAFREQDRFGAEVVAGAHKRLDGLRRLAVHHLEPGRNDARRDDRRDRIAGLHHIVERSHHDLRDFGLRNQFECHFGDDYQQTFRADREGEQIEAGRVERRAAEDDFFAVDRVAAQAEHVVHGEPVFEAVHAARIFRDVAADRAGDLRGRIGRVVKAERRGRLGHGEIAHARFDARGAGERIDVEDAVQLRQRQHEAVGARHRAARQSGARAARDDGYFQFMTDAQHVADLRPRLRQRDGERQLAERRQAVAFERRRLLRLAQQAGRGQHAGERAPKFGASRIELRRRHLGGAGGHAGMLNRNVSRDSLGRKS